MSDPTPDALAESRYNSVISRIIHGLDDEPASSSSEAKDRSLDIDQG